MQSYINIREKLLFNTKSNFSKEEAFFTHYLQNPEANNALHFANEASTYYELHKDELSFSREDETGIQSFLPLVWDGIPFPPPSNPSFSFIDLFAGIGGFRIPLQELGGKCVFTSEFNPPAQRTYETNFGEIPFGDITQLDLKIIPNHDVLCGGFPCQPFSISGKMKGFEDTRGTLIYHVLEIIELKKPKVVFLENVKHLLHHDKKRTLKTIITHLEELGYKVSVKLLNASDFGVPQNRERVIIIGHKEKEFSFDPIVGSGKKSKLKDFLEPEGSFEYLDEPFTLLENPKRQDSGLVFAGYRNKTIRKAGTRENTEHLSRVHKQPNRIYSTNGVHPALPSQESSGRFWILHEGKVRKMTIKECYRIMGFPDSFILTGSKGEQYRQIGNSVCVPMIKAIGEEIKKQLLC